MMALWLQGRIPEALILADQVPPGDSSYWAARAVLMGVRFDVGECTFEDALFAHQRAVDPPPADPDLHVSLLRNLAALLINVNRLVDARRALRSLETLMPLAHPRLRLAAQTVHWRLADAEDDYAEQLAAVANGFVLVEERHAIPPERVGLARLELHTQRLISALSNHDLRLAVQDAAEVRALAGHSLFVGWDRAELYDAILLGLTGQHESALNRLADAPPECRRANAKDFDTTEAELLIRAGRLPCADHILHRFENEVREKPGNSTGPVEVADADLAALRGLRALASRDPDQVWQAAETLTQAAKHDHPQCSSKANELLIDVVLSTRQLDLARRLLEREDPDAAKIRFRVPWARLHWQEGGRAAAAACFAAVLRDVWPEYPGYIARQLQFANDLSAYDLAQLWAMATPRQPLHSEPVPVEGEVGHTTQGRRARLLQLFDRHGRLTRAQAALLLKCAPGTATHDLAALETEGLIRRIATSGHLRTSYFSRCKRS